jgi:tRNA nucleotidyltransferase/poly(A) polymerase
LRFVRFKNKYDFNNYKVGNADLHSLQDFYKNILKEKSILLKNISAERIKQELDKILLLKNNVQALQDLKEIDFFKHIIPEIDVLEKVP